MSGRLFKREVRLTLARDFKVYEGSTSSTDASGATTLTRKQVGTAQETTVITDLRVQFSIEKNLKSDPNECSASIYNLSETARQALQTKPTKVTIDVGYDGDLARIFTGDLRWYSSSREGADWISKLQLGDGDRAMRFARISKSYKAGVKATQPVIDAANAMGFGITEVSKALKWINGTHSGGMSLHGPASRELTRLLEPYDLKWSIQDGRLQVLQVNETRDDSEIVVSEDAGMINTPEFGAPTSKGKKRPLTFRMLMYPGLIPGAVVNVQAKNMSPGEHRFKLTKVTHRGDNFSDEFHSECEAVAA